MPGMLDQLEVEIAQRLESIPFFAALTIHADPQKNVVEEISHKVAKLRTLIAPFVSAASDLNPSMGSGSYYDEIVVEVGVFQNPVIASADASPREICEQIHAALKGWQPDSLSAVLTPRRPGISYQATDGNLNVWNCSFETKGGPIIALPTVATPAGAAAAGEVTLTCATGGAAIFYTTDGSMPAPRNGTLYTAPFASADETVKARAFLAGYKHSTLLTLST